jgi:misacylated tRNA(Ala) deacylase
MTKALYLENSYLREFEAEVAKADGKFIVLNQTAFYPESGGQPTDTGVLIKNGEEFKVVFAKKIGSDISHEVDKEGLKAGDKVKGILDWDRRYLLMRYHTAAHVISGIFNKDCGALITGNQLNIDKGRIDFNLENFDREKMDEYFKKANELIKKDLKILVSYMPMEEAKKDPTLFKLASKLPPAVRELRIVEIEGFDRQADGGTHVKSLKEVGELKFTKAENKGTNNRRVYFKLV